jgi:Holliday junction DNA helicase RuvA
MFNSLCGTITYKDEGRVFLQSGDVEWEVLTSRTSSEDLPEVGARARVYVHLYHRDDQLRLYGFSQAGERDGFLDLLRVEGVGPRQALRILSGVEVHRLIEALDNEDLGFLSAIPGIGAKTAQKILLKLKGKMAAASPTGVSVEEDVINALVGMGFERKNARAAVSSAHRALKESAAPDADLPAGSGPGAAGRGPIAGRGSAAGRRSAAGIRAGGKGGSGQGTLSREELERELFKLAIAQLAGPDGRS